MIRARCCRAIITTLAFRFFFSLSFCLLPASPCVPHLFANKSHISRAGRVQKSFIANARATPLQYSRIRFLQATTSDTIVNASNIESTNFSVGIYVCVKCLRGILAIEARELYTNCVLVEIELRRRDISNFTDFRKILNVTLSC